MLTSLGVGSARQISTRWDAGSSPAIPLERMGLGKIVSQITAIRRALWTGRLSPR